MRATDFHQEYRNLWPEVANASLLVDLYRAHGVLEPERVALADYVPECEIEKAIALLKRINERSCIQTH